MPTLRQQKLVRINKLLAQSTNFSRREVDKLIDEQRVVVDNELVTKQGVQISINSIVKIDNKPINLKSDQQLNDIYIFNKPRGCLVTKSDPKNPLGQFKTFSTFSLASVGEPAATSPTIGYSLPS